MNSRKETRIFDDPNTIMEIEYDPQLKRDVPVFYEFWKGIEYANEEPERGWPRPNWDNRIWDKLYESMNPIETSGNLPENI